MNGLSILAIALLSLFLQAVADLDGDRRIREADGSASSAGSTGLNIIAPR